MNADIFLVDLVHKLAQVLLDFGLKWDSLQGLKINDLKLILSTFKIMFMKESTEGMEGEETIALSHQPEEEKKND